MDVVVLDASAKLPDAWHSQVDALMQVAFQFEPSFPPSACCGPCVCEVCVLDGDTVVGYAAFHEGHACAEMWNLAVRPSYRRRGIGTTISAVMEQLARRRSKRMDIRCVPSNAAAKALYEKLQYTAVSTTRYSPTASLLTYSKRV